MVFLQFDYINCNSVLAGIKNYFWCIGTHEQHCDVKLYEECMEEQTSTNPADGTILLDGHIYFVTVQVIFVSLFPYLVYNIHYFYCILMYYLPFL